MIRIDQPISGISEEILRFFPERLFEYLYGYLVRDAALSDGLTEIHLRKGAILTVVSRGKNFAVKDALHRYVIVNGDEISETLSSLCAHSVHSYDEEILKGTFSLANGLRIGVGGHALYRCGTIRSLKEINFLCLRVPRTVHAVSNELLAFLYRDGACDDGDSTAENGESVRRRAAQQHVKSALLFSPPGVGKTTILRDVIRSMTMDSADAVRGAVVDSREELFMEGEFQRCHADFLTGYPKGEGIRLATLSLSPQVIFCDEIGSEEEAEAVLQTQNTGVPLIATAHAQDIGGLLRRPLFRKLAEHRVFDCYIGLHRNPRTNQMHFDYTNGDAVPC